MMQAPHERVELLHTAALGSEAPQPFAERGVEGGVLRFGDEARLLNEVLIGAESDVFHTRIVYTRMVYTNPVFVTRSSESLRG